MKLKKIEFILILTILFGIHLSLPSNSYVRASYIFILAYIIILLTKGRIPFTKKGLLAYCSIFVLGMWPYLFYGSKIDNTMSYLFYIFQGFIIIFIIVKNNDLNWVKSIIYLYWAVNVIIGIYEIMTGNHLIYANISNYTQSIKNVPLGLFFNQNDYGIFISLITPYFFMKYFYSEKYRLYYLVTLSINIFLIIATGSFGAYLTLTVNLVIAFILIENKKKWRILYFPILVFIVYNVFHKLNILESLEIEYIIRKITRYLVSMNIVPTDRVNIIATYANIFKDHIFGVGAGQSTIIAKANYGISINPHSLLVEIGVEYGIVVLMIIIAVYCIYLINLIKSIASHENRIYFNLEKKAIFINYTTIIIWSNVPSRMLNGFDIFWIFIALVILISRNSKITTGDEI